MKDAIEPTWTEQDMSHIAPAAARIKGFQKQRKMLRLKIEATMQKENSEVSRCASLTKRPAASVRRKISEVVIAFVLMCLIAASARASAPASFDYHVSQVADLSWANTLTIANNTADKNIWSVNLTVEGIVSLQLPANWDAVRFDANSLDFYSLLAGSPPGGSDLPPGQSITIGFASTVQPGAIPFVVQFLDADFVDADVEGLLFADGSVLFAPEASTLAVLGVGALLLLKRGNAHANNLP